MKLVEGIACALLLIVFVVIAVLYFSGCASIPIRRTYSIEGGYGDARGAVSVTLEPWDRLHHDGKTVIEPR